MCRCNCSFIIEKGPFVECMTALEWQINLIFLKTGMITSAYLRETLP